MPHYPPHWKASIVLNTARKILPLVFRMLPSSVGIADCQPRLPSCLWIVNCQELTARAMGGPVGGHNAHGIVVIELSQANSTVTLHSLTVTAVTLSPCLTFTAIPLIGGIVYC